MEDANLVLISANRHIGRCVTRALVSAGAKVTTVGFEPSEVAEALEARPDLVMIDADHDPDAVSGAVNQISKSGTEQRALVLCRELSTSVAELILDGDMNHVVAKHGGVSITRDVIDETELIVTCGKLLSGKIFGMAPYLSIPDPKIHEMVLKGSKQRSTAIEAFEGFLEAIDCYRGLRAVIVTTADELLMNAIFSAPRDQNGVPKYEQRNRADQFELDAGEYVTFQYGCDGRNVVLAISDNFGSLNREKLMGYLGSGLRNEKGKPTGGSGGAGLGLHLVINSINQLVFNVQSGRRTEAIASFFIRNGIRGFRSSGQSLNLFMES